MRTLTALCIALAFILLPGPAAAAGIQSARTLVVNGTVIEPPVPLQEQKGRILVPLRTVAEALGARIDYNSIGPTVDCYYRDQRVFLPLNSWNFQRNGKLWRMDWTCQLIEGRVMVPYSFFNQAFEVTAYIDGRTGTVVVNGRNGG